MTFSSCILFLGWWMARQWQFSRGQVYPRPSISVRPGEVVTMGGNASIFCKSEQHQKAEFTLHKREFLDSFEIKETESDEVAFPIVKASHSDGGIYRCRYCFKSDVSHLCSNYSDSVNISIIDRSFSKPSIKVRTKEQISLGLNITIECQGPENVWGLTFFLLKSGILIASQKEESKKNTTEFILTRVRLEDAGIYTCQYHKLNPYVKSESSDPMELVLTENAFTATEVKLRLAAAGFVLLVLVVIVAEAVHSWRRGKL